MALTHSGWTVVGHPARRRYEASYLRHWEMEVLGASGRARLFSPLA